MMGYIDVDVIKKYNEMLKDEQNKFINSSKKSLDNSYFSKCSSYPITTMYKKLSNKYNFLVEKYSKITSFMDLYYNDIKNVELTIAGKQSYSQIEKPSLTIKIRSLPTLEKYNEEMTHLVFNSTSVSSLINATSTVMSATISSSFFNATNVTAAVIKTGAIVSYSVKSVWDIGTTKINDKINNVATNVSGVFSSIFSFINNKAETPTFTLDDVKYNEIYESYTQVIDKDLNMLSLEKEAIKQQIQSLENLKSECNKILHPGIGMMSLSSSIMASVSTSTRPMLDEACKKYGFESYAEYEKYKEQLEEQLKYCDAVIEEYNRLKEVARYECLDCYSEFQNYVHIPDDIDERSMVLSTGRGQIKTVERLYNYSTYVDKIKDVNGLDYARAIQEKINSGLSFEFGFDSETQNLLNLLKLSELGEEYSIYEKRYNFIYDNFGKEVANQYLINIESDVNAILGKAKAVEFLNSLSQDQDDVLDKIANHLKVSVKGLSDGVQSFGSGLGYVLDAAGAIILDKNPSRASSIDEYESMYIMQALKVRDENGISEYSGALLSDNYRISQGIGNMAPSIALASLGLGALGQVSLGVSAGGNSYHSALVEGYSNASAITYGLISGFTESITERYLGALPFLSDVEVTSLKSYLKAIIKEGNEEAIQNVFDAVVRSVVFDEKIEGKDLVVSTIENWRDGAITAGLLQGPRVISSTANIMSVNNAIKNNIITENDIKNQLNSAGIKTDNIDMAQLIEQNSSFLVNYVNVINRLNSIQQNQSNSQNINNVVNKINSNFEDMKNISKQIRDFNDKVDQGINEKVVIKVNDIHNIDIGSLDSIKNKELVFFAIGRKIYSVDEINDLLDSIIKSAVKRDDDSLNIPNNINSNQFVSSDGKLSLDNFKYNKYDKISSSINYLRSNLQKYVYNNTNNFVGLNEHIVSEGLYHFASEDSIDKIINSGYVKPSDMISSYGAPKSFFFAGVPEVGAYATNLDHIPLTATAVKINVDYNTISNPNFKVRSIDDGAISYNGRFNFDPSKASKEYFILVKINDKLEYKRVTKEIYTNYANTPEGKMVAEFISQKINVEAIKNDYLHEIVQKNSYMFPELTSIQKTQNVESEQIVDNTNINNQNSNEKKPTIFDNNKLNVIDRMKIKTIKGKIDDYVQKCDFKNIYTLFSSEYWENIISRPNLTVSGLEYFVDLLMEWDNELVVPKSVGEYIQSLVENPNYAVGIHRTPLDNDIFSSKIANKIFTDGLLNYGDASSGHVIKKPDVNKTVSFVDNMLNALILLKSSYKGSIGGGFLLTFPREYFDNDFYDISDKKDRIYKNDNQIYPEFVIGYIDANYGVMNYFSREQLIKTNNALNQKDIVNEAIKSAEHNELELKAEVLRTLTTLDSNSSKIEIARKLYLELNARLHYSNEVNMAGLQHDEEASNRFLENAKKYTVNFQNLEGNEIVCKSWSELYVELLQSVGIDARVISANNLNHWWVEINIGDQKIFADATDGINGSNDLVRSKIGEETFGFIIVDSSCQEIIRPMSIYKDNKTEYIDRNKKILSSIDSKILYADNGVYMDQLLKDIYEIYNYDNNIQIDESSLFNLNIPSTMDGFEAWAYFREVIKIANFKNFKVRCSYDYNSELKNYYSVCTIEYNDPNTSEIKIMTYDNINGRRLYNTFDDYNNATTINYDNNSLQNVDATAELVNTENLDNVEGIVTPERIPTVKMPVELENLDNVEGIVTPERIPTAQMPVELENFDNIPKLKINNEPEILDFDI